MAAAFGRLCVETTKEKIDIDKAIAAAFGRLCVETTGKYPEELLNAAAAFGRLCVETINIARCLQLKGCSRLRAAVC